MNGKPCWWRGLSNPSLDLRQENGVSVGSVCNCLTDGHETTLLIICQPVAAPPFMEIVFMTTEGL